MIEKELTRPFDVTTLDINEDSREDIVISTINMESGNEIGIIYWYEAPSISGSTWTQHPITDQFTGSDVYTGDIDGDGKNDFVASSLYNAKISWFSYQWNGSEISWTEHVVDDGILIPGDISLNDVDGDGDLDIVVDGWYDNNVIWYENKLNKQTLITLKYFEATAGNSSVILTWATDTEIDNAGFNLYRSASGEEKYIKINDALIPAKGSSVEGASYTWIDRDVQNRTSYSYQLEDVDIYGKSTFHGPESSTPRLMYIMRK